MTFPIPCVSDTRQTENLPENQEICIGNGGEQRISVFFRIRKTLKINAKNWEIKKPNDVSVRQRDKKWWPDPESNWGHGDFQSPALPTELSCHLMLLNKHPFSFFSSSILKKFRFFHQETAFHLLPRREFFNASPREGHATSVPGPGPYRNHAPHGRANSRKPAPHHNDVSRQPASRSPPPRRREPRQIE